MRLGIYGGTFSPPHSGHVNAARSFTESMKLDKLLIIPTFIPPHKEFREEASCEERLEMCRLAFRDIPVAEVSDIEIKRGGKSYTYETLEELSKSGDDLYFLIGTDMLLSFDRWKNPERILDLCTLCYVRRESDRELDGEISAKISEYREKYGREPQKIDHTVTEISSSEIRRLLTNDTDCASVLPSDVLGYIKKRGLYK
ncbi:MAG: nicotinate (nicotinamide) nucleotide adenylyltransferase [Clostridia bacterium]|nr:nicotinate (nicotinamide) nucleotide adenylyltransferase [Clostridia bacterium]